VSSEKPHPSGLRSSYARPIRPTDAAAVLSMHERCSRETRYGRWLTPAAHFPGSYLRSVLAGTAEQIAVVAICERQPDEVVGLASAALTSDGKRELGILVEDRCQARGIGSLLLDSLLALLDPNEDLYAFSLTENRWLLDKLTRYGTVTIRHDHGVSQAYVGRTASTRLSPSRAR
jgi:hypothetical protein